MDVFGGSPASRLNKTITDMDEKFNVEMDSHVNLIKINHAKIDTLDEKCTKELGLHNNLFEINDKNISALNDGVQVLEIKIKQFETFVSTVDKYFLENNNKTDSYIESIEAINKNIKDLKVTLALALARIIILEDKLVDK